MRSGRTEGFPYSLSRWTDVPGDQSKWDWFKKSLEAGRMQAIDQRSGIPAWWSLKPEDTLGLVFWTKQPTNLIKDKALLEGYKVTVHVTATGWHEVEKGAPILEESRQLLKDTVSAFGVENVIWRFSPVPVLPLSELMGRFYQLAEAASEAGLKRVYLSFLQENDLLPETRPWYQRLWVLETLANSVGYKFGLDLLLCNEDRTLSRWAERFEFYRANESRFSWGEEFGGLPPETLQPENLKSGICADPNDYGYAPTRKEGCGCVLMVDPFTINESCSFGCTYCLAPQTRILYADLTWRPIGEVKVGDRLVGFDENTNDKETYGRKRVRKFRESVVEAVVWSKKPTIRVTTPHSEVITTSDHKWLKSRNGWAETRKLRYLDRHGSNCSKIQSLGYVPKHSHTSDYQVGYIAGMSLGDGTFKYQPGQRSSSAGFPQAYWRVALVDREPLERLQTFLKNLDITVNIRDFDPGTSGFQGTKPMYKVETRALGPLAQLHTLCLSEIDSQEYRRGFLAGIFDAEGHVEGSTIRISQKDVEVLNRIASYANKLGFSMKVEPWETIRLNGFLRDRLRFYATLDPVLKRKMPDWRDWEFGTEDVSVISVTPTGQVEDVVDIQTSTGTFIAEGLATHNCYASDKTLATKKRNTTRRLPVVR